MTELGSARSLQTPSVAQEIDALALVSTIWRGKFVVAFFAVVAAALAVYYVELQAVPKFRSITSLVIEPNQQTVIDIESVVSGVSTDTAAINTEIEVIRSRELLEKVVVALKLTEDPEFNERLQEPSKLRSLIVLARSYYIDPDAKPVVVPEDGISEDERVLIATVNRLNELLSVANKRNTHVFTIQATTSNAMKSARIVDALADIYIKSQIDLKYLATENAISWLSERVVELEKELAADENRVKEMRASMEIASGEALEALNQQLRTSRERLRQTETDVLVKSAELEKLVSLQGGGDLDAIVQATGDTTLARLVRRLKTGDTSVQPLFDQQVERVITTTRVEVQRAQAQVAVLTEAVLRIETQVAQRSEQLIKLEQAERDLAATRTLYETFLNRLKEASVQRGLQQADSRVLSRATPGKLVSPRKLATVAGSIFLGILFGAFLVLLRQYRHAGFRLPDDLENQVAVPVIGQLPKIAIRRRRGLIRYLRDRPTSAAIEAIRNVRTSVLLSRSDKAPQVIMTTSAVPGDGKTTMSISLAHNLSELGKKTLLIEGDIRRRTFREYFDAPQTQPGLVSAIQGTAEIEDCTILAPDSSLEVMMGESSKANAADLFSSDNFGKLIKKLRETYDYIVIDTPPVLLVPDARVIGPLTDAILFIVAWDKTPRVQVKQAINDLRKVDLQPSGVVLTQISARGMRRYGYRDYGLSRYYGNRYYDK